MSDSESSGSKIVTDGFLVSSDTGDKLSSEKVVGIAGDVAGEVVAGVHRRSKLKTPAKYADFVLYWKTIDEE